MPPKPYLVNIVFHANFGLPPSEEDLYPGWESSVFIPLKSNVQMTLKQVKSTIEKYLGDLDDVEFDDQKSTIIFFQEGQDEFLSPINNIDQPNAKHFLVKHPEYEGYNYIWNYDISVQGSDKALNDLRKNI